MVIYIDVLLCINIFINTLLLLCVKKFLSLKTSYIRLIICAAVSSVFSLIVFLPRLSGLVLFLLKIIFGVLIVFLTFGKTNVKNFIKRLCVFLFVNIGFCGIIMLFCSLSGNKGLIIFNDVIYMDISPIILLLVTAACYIVTRILQKITGKQESKNIICTLSFYYQNKNYNCIGKTDTGCSLKEPFSSAPVIVINKKIIPNFIPQTENMRVIPFQSLGGNGIVYGFKAQRLIINEKEINKIVYIAICDNIFNGEFDAVINPEVMI